MVSKTLVDKSGTIDYLDLIGVEFEYGGRGPETYDCYGLAMELHRRIGVELPDYRSPKVLSEISSLLAAEKYRWDKIAEKPTDGTIQMSVFEVGTVIEIRMNSEACHVGFVHRPRRFLHTYETSNGVQDNEIYDWRERILGIYRYRGA